MELKFFMPTKVLMGKGIVGDSIKEIKSYGKKAFIITGKRSSKINGSLNDVVNALDKAQINYVIFDDIEENPSIETVVRAASIGKLEEVDFIIGIGGGSPIDASKAIGVMVKNPHITGETLFTSSKLESLSIVTVPTTSGTGTETTQYSIITDHKDMTKKNLGQTIFPALSLLDPSYTMNMGVYVTRNTAIDALSHIVEGYLNVNASIISDTLAEKGMMIWGECIPSLIKGEFDYETREKLMISSTLAGAIIAQTGTSLPHGMGYPLTYFKGVPHGIANGCLYVEYLKVFKNREKVEKIYKILSLSSHKELEEVLNKLTKVNIDITKGEIVKYTTDMISNETKLKNHPETVGFDQIYNIYAQSLL
ncbi:MAG: iron-containing alcohol dehydrogenase family protein [Clostridium sp.]